MINTRLYIMDLIKRLKDKFPRVNMKYAYDNDTSFHLVEVYPKSILRNEGFLLSLHSELDDYFSKFDDDLLIGERSKYNDMTNTLFDTRTASIMISEVLEAVKIEFSVSPSYPSINNNIIAA